MTKPLIGFIGQGFIGKSYADDFEARGYEIVRYSKERFAENKDKIADCDIVFIAVPTPSTPQGFDISIVESVLSLIGEGKTAVIKSTMVVGTTERLQKQFPGIFVFHSPEFLTEKTAAYDAAHPDRNIVGIPTDAYSPELCAIAREKAVEVLETLPFAPMQTITGSREAELIKYGGNNWFVFKIMFMNILFDLCKSTGADYQKVIFGMSGDPRIGHTHLEAVHSGRVDANRTVGRGAGGHCFIKDFAALKEMVQTRLPIDDCARNGLMLEVLNSIEKLNLHLLNESNKDQDLVEGVYGK